MAKVFFMKKFEWPALKTSTRLPWNVAEAMSKITSSITDLKDNEEG